MLCSSQSCLDDDYMELEEDKLSGSIELTEDVMISDTLSSSSSSKPKTSHKKPHIENLFEFLGLQSFDGKFLPNKSFYKFFYKNDSNDFINLKQEIEKEMGK